MSKVNQLRLQQAALLLQLPELSLQHIAEAVGFSSPYYLSTVFKRQYGVAPSYFRAQRLAQLEQQER